METIKIANRDVPIIQYVNTEDGRMPLIDINMMSDDTWRKLSEKGAKNNGRYKD